MKRHVSMAGMIALMILACTSVVRAEKWVKNSVDLPNQNIEANYFDSASIKVNGALLSWTEKFVLSEFGGKHYTKHLMQYPACRENIDKKGAVAYHQIDFEISKGKARRVAKRNYTAKDELICTDKEMGTEFNTEWSEIEYGSAMYNRYYIFVSKYNVGNI